MVKRRKCGKVGSGDGAKTDAAEMERERLGQLHGREIECLE